jgi:hypothetical protein
LSRVSGARFALHRVRDNIPDLPVHHFIAI